MKYIEFEKALRQFPVFSIRDILKMFPGFDNRRLVEWQKKGYLIKIRRGYYCFEEVTQERNFAQVAANKIYTPSYISLESALAFYNLIPEEAFITTSITTKNTAEYQTLIGHFSYRNVKPGLFFGFDLHNENRAPVKIAQPEKAILDYLYLNTLNDMDSIESVRFNALIIKELINIDRLKNYVQIFNSKVLNRRTDLLLKMMNA